MQDIQFLGGATLDGIIRDLISTGVIGETTQNGWRVRQYASGWARAWIRKKVTVTNGFGKVPYPFGQYKATHKPQVYAGNTYQGSSTGMATAYVDIRDGQITNEMVVYVRTQTGDPIANGTYLIPFEIIAKIK